MEQRQNARVGGNGRSPRKPIDQRHLPLDRRMNEVVRLMAWQSLIPRTPILHADRVASDQQSAETPFANEHLVTYSPAVSPASRESFALLNRQSDTWPVPECRKVYQRTGISGDNRSLACHSHAISLPCLAQINPKPATPRVNTVRFQHSGQTAVPNDPLKNLGHDLENRDCPEKIGTSGHLSETVNTLSKSNSANRDRPPVRDVPPPWSRREREGERERESVGGGSRGRLLCRWPALPPARESLTRCVGSGGRTKPGCRAACLCLPSHDRPGPRAAVAEWLDCLPPTKVNRVQSPAGSLSDFLKWESCQTMPLVGRFSRGSPVFPLPCIPELFHSHLIPPSSALKTSLLRATQIIQLNLEDRAYPVSTLLEEDVSPYWAESEFTNQGPLPSFVPYKSALKAGYLYGQEHFPSSFQDKIDVKHGYTEVDFVIGSQFIRHALDDSEPIGDLQGNK
ncbi:hypothetical protein PR048_002880 [Dryococelus australis]|uniref:Uncharacterized protein n=1 Tax=Dryococelus australis TaxID=614101 RepID=A0ABQ9INR3_9NEOP|nr:hypothetical protein PR048_002880 [Dryococelus australis]